MDDETVQAAKSMARDFGKRVRLDFLNDQKANQAMARRVKGAVSAYRVGRAALMNAVAAEGPEVLSNAAEGYWRDMGKRYPWLANGDSGRTGRRATSIFRDGKWWKRAGGKWIPEVRATEGANQDDGANQGSVAADGGK